jgi:hypothetical protein
VYNNANPSLISASLVSGRKRPFLETACDVDGSGRAVSG